MRRRDKRKEMLGQTRIVTVFLWLPLNLYVSGRGYYETRWLEKARVKMRYEKYPLGYGWEPDCFMADEVSGK